MDDPFVRELLADHSRNPRQYGTLPEPDIEAETENPRCVGPTHPEGDQVALMATLSADRSTVETVRFTGCGCTLSQAGASLLTTEMVETPVEAILDWDSETIEDLVGMELTPARLQCAELVLVAFRDALSDHESDAGPPAE